MYKEALQLGITFNSSKVGGQFSVQSLFDLPLKHPTKASLDEIATAVYYELESTKGKTISFVSATSADTSVLELKLNILKDIIKDKIVERDSQKDAKENKEKKEKLLDILYKKQNAALETLSETELKALIAQL